MNQAKVSEIFESYQGEGPFAGSKQLFIRFWGCNLDCEFCDTYLESYKTFTREALLGKILDFEDDYNELSLTGGEPLMYADFLEEFLPLFRKHRKHEVYLETNGTLPEELERVIKYVDIVSMDVKLPSSAGYLVDFWGMHKAFARLASTKELVIKAVVTGATAVDDIKMLGDMLPDLPKNVTVVLQPVTPVSETVKEADGEMISYFKQYLEKGTGKKIMVLGQVHKCLGIK